MRCILLYGGVPRPETEGGGDTGTEEMVVVLSVLSLIPPLGAQ